MKQRDIPGVFPDPSGSGWFYLCRADCANKDHARCMRQFACASLHELNWPKELGPREPGPGGRPLEKP